MNKEELLPCPFCGETKELLLWNGEDDYNNEQVQVVVCDYIKQGCGSSGSWEDTEQEAVKAWNTRISND